MLNIITEHPLSTLIFLPLLFAAIIPFLPDCKTLLHRFAVGASTLLFALSIGFWWQAGQTGATLTEVFDWLPMLGIKYAVGADGLSWTLVLLTTFLMVMAIFASQTSIDKRLKLYYSMIFVLASSILGVFLARDLFLYVIFWELELIPMYLLIAIWGGARREYAALKFVLYTLFGSVFMLSAVIALFFASYQIFGTATSGILLFDNLGALHAHGLSLTVQILLFLGFFIGFAIKLPMVPFHTWLPDAHVEAPTPVSMLLAGILLKMGSYGMLRFCFGWFPEAAQVLAPYIVLFGVINIVYTAGIAMVQADLKKLIAYSSVSHMGFVLLGLGALNAPGFNGAVFQMISHGVISAGLFMIVGVLYSRTHTRQIAELGGFGKLMPQAYFFGLLIAMSSLGLPLLAGFPAETLVFYGAFLSNAFAGIQGLTVIAGLSVLLGAAYLLWMMQRVFMGNFFPKWSEIKDLIPSETFVLTALSLLIVLFGLVPSLVSSQFESEMTAFAAPYGKLIPVVAEAEVPATVSPKSHGAHP
jgi:NADH-quinone oxidoreductase subunit M